MSSVGLGGSGITLGLDSVAHDLHEGILARSEARRPGVVGLEQPRAEVRVAVSAESPRMRPRLEPRPWRPLGPGNVGPDVKALQERLNARGMLFPPLLLDGVFGFKTRSEVVRMQRTEGLLPTGYVGREERVRLSRDRPRLKPVQRGRATVPAAGLGERLVRVFDRQREDVHRAFSGALDDPERLGRLQDVIVESLSEVGVNVSSEIVAVLGMPTWRAFEDQLRLFAELVVGARDDTDLVQASIALGELLDLVGADDFLRFVRSYRGSYDAEPTTEERAQAEEPARARQQQPKEELSWIDFMLLGEDGRPRAGEVYEIKMPDGNTIRGKIPSNGLVQFPKVPVGVCEISFPELELD